MGPFSFINNIMYVLKKGPKMNKQTFTILSIVMIFLYVCAGLGVVGYKLITPKNVIERAIEKEIKETVETKKEEIIKAIPKLKIVNDSKPRTLALDAPIEYKSWLYYLNDIQLYKIGTTTVDLAIIETQKDRILFSKDQIDKLKVKSDGSNRHIFAYLSLGDAENYRGYWKKEWNKKKPSWLGNESKIWKGNHDVTNLMSDEWLEISKGMVDEVINSGYDGILISGLKDTNKNTLKFLQEITSYIKSKNENIKIFVQDIESFASNDAFVSMIDGVVKQGLVYSELSNGLTGRKNIETKIKTTVNNLNLLKSKEKDVLVVEYVSGKKWEEAKKIIEDNKFIGLSAPIRLNKID
jgi:cysteinyl-tRNA synthetase